jgi:FixJ family two-component response regulator
MTRWRPVAYVAVRDDEQRSRITAALRDLGWSVQGARTGFHLIDALADLILGNAPWLQVGLVIVDDALPGCRGSSIASGLRELGIDVPVAVIGPDGDAARALALARSLVDDHGALETTDEDDPGATVVDRGARGALELVTGRGA